MKWETKNNGYIADGKFGRFSIVKKGHFYYGRYSEKNSDGEFVGKKFNFSRTNSIKDLKAKIQENFYWEEE